VRLVHLLQVTLLISCSGSLDNTSENENRDMIRLDKNGVISEYFELSGLPQIDCDPRIDWSYKQIIAYIGFSGSGQLQGYEKLFHIMFPNIDDVGSYTVHGDSLQSTFIDGAVTFIASPLYSGSSGLVIVTESGDNISGTFEITLVTSDQSQSVNLSGQFQIAKGNSLSCE